MMGGWLPITQCGGDGVEKTYGWMRPLTGFVFMPGDNTVAGEDVEVWGSMLISHHVHKVVENARFM
jgi:hypothetical protein